MINKVIIATVLTATFAVPNISHATSCKSTWVKASGKLRTFFVPVAKLVCDKINTEDEASAKQCLEDVEKWAAKADEIKKEWNKDEGQWKIGPRALPNNRVQTGSLVGERQFVGAPVLNAEYEISIDRTGGRAKKDMIVKICFVAEDGHDVSYEEIRLNKNGQTKFNKTYTGVEGTYPLIRFKNERFGVKVHKYTIRGAGRGEPSAVAKARKTINKGKKKAVKRGTSKRRRRR